MLRDPVIQYINLNRDLPLNQNQTSNVLATNKIIENNLDTTILELDWYTLSRLNKMGLPSNIVNKPVDFAFNQDPEIVSDLLDPVQTEEFQKYLTRIQFYNKIMHAIKLARLYGGSIIVMNGINVVDLTTPLTYNEIYKYGLYLEVFDKFQGIYADSAKNGIIRLESKNGVKSWRIRNKEVHPSRVIVFNGEVADSFQSQLLQGWGLSVLTPVKRSLNILLKATEVVTELIDESKLTVHQSGDTESITNTNVFQERQRLSEDLANNKNYKSVISIGPNDKITNIEHNISNYSDFLHFALRCISADSGIPTAFLCAESAQGFSSGEDSLEIFATFVKSKVQLRYSQQILALVSYMATSYFYRTMQVKIQFSLDNTRLIFPNPRIATRKEESEIRSNLIRDVNELLASGIIDVQQAKTMLNKEKVLNVDL